MDTSSVCAWCQPPQEDDEPVSHGICEFHRQQLEADIEELKREWHQHPQCLKAAS